ncbi:hypothetical protein, partial [Salmonella sp. s51228]|uniref:hypothetical protein n=1 Tax=Salmonella sp. s51228 TaxID=3159652 RepID=UPI00397F743C
GNALCQIDRMKELNLESKRITELIILSSMKIFSKVNYTDELLSKDIIESNTVTENCDLERPSDTILSNSTN